LRGLRAHCVDVHRVAAIIDETLFTNPVSRRNIMERKAIRTLLTTLAISMTAFMFAATASADDDMAEMRAISKAANLITPEQAVEKALSVKPGTVVDADIDRKFKGYYYEIEIIDAQAVEWEIDIDAETGEVRWVKREWFD